MVSGKYKILDQIILASLVAEYERNAIAELMKGTYHGCARRADPRPRASPAEGDQSWQYGNITMGSEHAQLRFYDCAHLLKMEILQFRLEHAPLRFYDCAHL